MQLSTVKKQYNIVKDQAKIYFGLLKNSGEVLDRLKARYFNVTNLFAYYFVHSLHLFTS